MHPDKGPIVFTTQDKLFSHFAEEHGSPIRKVNALNVKSAQKSSQSVDCKPVDNEESSITRKRNQFHQKIFNEQQTKIKKESIEDNILGPEFTKTNQGDKKGQGVSSSPSIVIATPPQLQQSCPVCHKVRKRFKYF